MPPRFGGPMGGPPPMMGGRPPHGRKGMPNDPFRTPQQPKETADDFYEEEFDLSQMEKECENMLDFHFLTRENASFSKNASNFLTLTIHENPKKCFEQVDIVRTFPFYAPNCFLSVRESDGKKRELGIIENLEQDFDNETITIICEFLKVRYYMPTIKKILQLKEEGGYIHVTAMTDSGKTNFSLQSNGACITNLSDTRILITDLEGSRYEIPDLLKLSIKERKKLDLLL